MPLGAGAEQVGQAAPNGRWPDVLAPAWGHCHAQVSALCIARRHRDRRNNSRPGLLQDFGTGAPPPPQDEAIHYSTRVMPDLVTHSLDPAIRARANDGD
jgi:hypothetical protein